MNTASVAPAPAQDAPTKPKRVDSRPVEGFRLDFAVGCLAVGLLSHYLVSNWSYAIEFTFETAPLIHNELYYWSIPIVGLSMYLIGVHVVDPWYRRNYHPSARSIPGEPESAAVQRRNAAVLFALKGWNLFLCVFSVCMACGIVIPLVGFALEGNLTDLICDTNSRRWRGPMFFWLYLFNFSKPLELIDTLFLSLRNKKIGFLHWFHHTTVFAYCWFAITDRFVPGTVFGAVNAIIHSVMYMYFYRAACGVKLTYSKVITLMQLAQMGLGIFITAVWTHYRFTYTEACPSSHPYIMIASSTAMYASYLALFAMFYINRYRRHV